MCACVHVCVRARVCAGMQQGGRAGLCCWAVCQHLGLPNVVLLGHYICALGHPLQGHGGMGACIWLLLQNFLVPFIQQSNPGRPIPSSKVLAFSGIDAANSWLSQNPERVSGGIHFSTTGQYGAWVPHGKQHEPRRGDPSLAALPGSQALLWPPRPAPPRPLLPAVPGQFDFLLQVNTTVQYFKDVSRPQRGCCWRHYSAENGTGCCAFLLVVPAKEVPQGAANRLFGKAAVAAPYTHPAWLPVAGPPRRNSKIQTFSLRCRCKWLLSAPLLPTTTTRCAGKQGDAESLATPRHRPVGQGQ